MSAEHSPQAERVLLRVRTSEPASDIGQRVLARVEQRIAIESDPTRAGTGAAGEADALLPRASRWR